MYYNKKKYKYKKQKTRQLFDPASKNPYPNYYQQKGRVIRSSPLHIYQAPTIQPTLKTYEGWYQQLLKMNYPNVGPNREPFFKPFVVNRQLDLEYVTQETLVFDQQFINNHDFPGVPDLPTGWHYNIELQAISYRRNPVTDNSLFKLVLNSALLDESSQNFEIIKKTSNQWTQQIWGTFQIIPISSNLAGSYQLVIGSSIPNEQYVELITNDENISDNGYYPFIANYDPTSVLVLYRENTNTMHGILYFSYLFQAIKD